MLILTIGLGVILFGVTVFWIMALNKIASLELDLRCETAERKSMVALVSEYDAANTALYARLESDANGSVSRGARGRFVSAKGKAA